MGRLPDGRSRHGRRQHRHTVRGRHGGTAGRRSCRWQDPRWSIWSWDGPAAYRIPSGGRRCHPIEGVDEGRRRRHPSGRDPPGGRQPTPSGAGAATSGCRRVTSPAGGSLAPCPPKRSRSNERVGRRSQPVAMPAEAPCPSSQPPARVSTRSRARPDQAGACELAPVSAGPIDAVPRGRALTVAVVGAGPVRGDGGCSLDGEMPPPRPPASPATALRRSPDPSVASRAAGGRPLPPRRFASTPNPSRRPPWAHRRARALLQSHRDRPLFVRRRSGTPARTAGWRPAGDGRSPPEARRPALDRCRAPAGSSPHRRGGHRSQPRRSGRAGGAAAESAGRGQVARAAVFPARDQPRRG